MPLTAKQQRFVEEYVVDFNASDAARRAGYSEKTAYSIGQENLNKPEIASAIRQLTQEATTATRLTRELVIDGLLGIAADDDQTASARVRAYELLGKHLAMFTDRVEVTQMPSSEMVQDWIAAMKADIDAAESR